MVVETASLSEMEEFYADLILVKGKETHKAIFAMVSAFPDAIAQDYVLVLCTVATVVEAESSTSVTFPLPLHTEIYKFAAILALDVLELQRNGEGRQTGDALISHWCETDEKLFV
jgi:hypothetical protein